MLRIIFSLRILFSLLLLISCEAAHASKGQPCETSPPSNTPKLDEFLNTFINDCIAQGTYSGIVELNEGQYRTVSTFVIPSNFSLTINGTCSSNIISCDIHAPYGIFVSSGASLRLTTCSVTAEFGNRLFNVTGPGSSLYISNAFLYSSSQLVYLNNSLEAVFDDCTFAPDGGAGASRLSSETGLIKRYLNLTQSPRNHDRNHHDHDHNDKSSLVQEEDFPLQRHAGDQDGPITGVAICSAKTTRISLINCELDTCSGTATGGACLYFDGSGLDSDRSDVTLENLLAFHGDGGARALIEAANVTMTVHNSSFINCFGTSATAALYDGIGGVIYFDGSSPSSQNVLTVTQSKFTECATPCAGAAIAGCGELVVLNSTFSDNSLGNIATEKGCKLFKLPFGGAAIAWFGNMTMADNTFQNNIPNDVLNITSCYTRRGKNLAVVN